MASDTDSDVNCTSLLYSCTSAHISNSPLAYLWTILFPSSYIQNTGLLLSPSLHTFQAATIQNSLRSRATHIYWIWTLPPSIALFGCFHGINLLLSSYMFIRLQLVIFVWGWIQLCEASFFQIKSHCVTRHCEKLVLLVLLQTLLIYKLASLRWRLKHFFWGRGVRQHKFLQVMWPTFMTLRVRPARNVFTSVSMSAKAGYVSKTSYKGYFVFGVLLSVDLKRRNLDTIKNPFKH